MSTVTPPDPRLDLPAAVLDDPYRRFARVYARAEAADPKGFNAVCVATAGDDGRPAARMVLLKGFDERGFVFYTNFRSRKGRELTARPFAALCFHWPQLEEQVRVEGRVEVVSDAEADAYFASRPRGSRIGAWASEQSSELGDRGTLEARVARYEAEFSGREVPRPPHWSGWRLCPDRFEFWIGLPSRLHDRTEYRPDGARWSRRLLFP